MLKQRAHQKVVRFLQIPFTPQQKSAQENSMSFLEQQNKRKAYAYMYLYPSIKFGLPDYFFRENAVISVYKLYILHRMTGTNESKALFLSQYLKVLRC